MASEVFAAHRYMKAKDVPDHVARECCGCPNPLLHVSLLVPYGQALALSAKPGRGGEKAVLGPSLPVTSSCCGAVGTFVYSAPETLVGMDSGTKSDIYRSAPTSPPPQICSPGPVRSACHPHQARRT